MDEYLYRGNWEGRPAKVAVCIATFRRREGLERLLRSFEKLVFVTDPQPEVVVLVVDNDPASGTAAEIERRKSNYRFPLICLDEPRRGLSFARNTAVGAALSAGANWIAFVDDDEIVRPNWLEELLKAAWSFRADVVAGPVIPQFEVSSPKWIRKGRFFDRPRPATGTYLKSTRDGNVLISAQILARFPVPFDQEFARTGGQDTLFFAQVASVGARIVWTDEAVVDERVPAHRVTVRWLLRRSLIGGNNWARIERKLRPGYFRVFWLAGKGIGNIVWGTALLVPMAVAGRHAVVRCAMKIWLGAGMMRALFGNRVMYYSDAHSSKRPVSCRSETDGLKQGRTGGCDAAS
jgi:succinoglycan biosynthesis protein ExoM